MHFHMLSSRGASVPTPRLRGQVTLRMNIHVVSNSIVRGAIYGKIFELKSASDPFKMQYIVHMHKASLDS